MTYTYAEMKVSPRTFEEVRARLVEAGYEDQIHEEDGREALDMHGIALTRGPGAARRMVVNPETEEEGA